MSKLRFFSVCLAVLVLSAWSLSQPASAQQGPLSPIDPVANAPMPVSTTSQFKNAEYYLRTYGKKAKPVGGILVFDPDAKVIRFVTKGKTELEISNDVITKMLYEPKSTPRYLLAVLVSKYFLLTESTKHFLTIEYKGPNGDAQTAVIRLDKGNYELALTTAETQTGVRVARIPER